MASVIAAVTSASLWWRTGLYSTQKEDFWERGEIFSDKQTFGGYSQREMREGKRGDSPYPPLVLSVLIVIKISMYTLQETCTHYKKHVCYVTK